MEFAILGIKIIGKLPVLGFIEPNFFNTFSLAFFPTFLNPLNH